MEISKRQEKLLELTVREYIRKGRPISSKALTKRYNLKVSPATIRNELQELSRKGYLFQPHTSAGRVPSDKGYRFFVNNLIERRNKELIDRELIKEIKEMERKIKDEIRFFQEMTRYFADLSNSLTISYFLEKSILWREGWGKVFQDPEFEDRKKMRSFLRLVNDFEEGIEDIFSLEKEENCPLVFIGEESPFKSRDFTIMVSRCGFPEKKSYFAILGPKRMAYDKNIILLNSMLRLLEENYGKEEE